ncbi:MAG: hypothetical protein H6721_13750 [Sandaracinus sp.]|nr:hypothetical protein [Sandaracinus sp.]MCB9633180.1 hypothetical protein [Sandaracinus sp.]
MSMALMGCAVAQDPPMVPPDVASFRATGEVRFQAVEVRCDDERCEVRSGRHPNAEASAYAMFVLAGVLVLIPFAVGRRFGFSRSLAGPTAICVAFGLGLAAWAGAKLWVVRHARRRGAPRPP